MHKNERQDERRKERQIKKLFEIAFIKTVASVLCMERDCFNKIYFTLRKIKKILDKFLN